jgi:hypothetical protein
MIKKWQKQMSSIVIVLLLTGCSPTTSIINKLKSNALEPNLTDVFWSDEHDKQSRLWTTALAYCTEHDEKPNCSLVNQVNVIRNGSTAIPAYGTSGQPIVIPSSIEEGN